MEKFTKPELLEFLCEIGDGATEFSPTGTEGIVGGGDGDL